MTEDKKDPGYVGIEPFVTGKYDPFWKEAAAKNDADFQKKIDGLKHPSLAEINGDWIVNTTKVAFKGAYAVASYPIYLIGGLLLGSARWLQWSLKGKK